jgi:hypothetical protein
VLDCGLFHVFDDDDRIAFVDSLQSVVPRGVAMSCCASATGSRVCGGPRRVTRDEISASFADGWRVDSIEASTIDITIDPNGARAWLSALTRI